MFESKTGCYPTKIEQVSATQRVKNECLLKSVKRHFSEALRDLQLGYCQPTEKTPKLETNLGMAQGLFDP